MTPISLSERLRGIVDAYAQELAPLAKEGILEAAAALEGKKVRLDLDPDVALAALQKVFAIQAEGTSKNPLGFGPPFEVPFFIIDTSSAEMEVNWPGNVIEVVRDVRLVGERLRAARVAALIEALGEVK